MYIHNKDIIPIKLVIFSKIDNCQNFPMYLILSWYTGIVFQHIIDEIGTHEFSALVVKVVKDGTKV